MTIALVLGAGSSLAFEYPTGIELREKILALGDSDHKEFRINAGLQSNIDHFLQFLKAFKFSGMASIDAFLARRNEFSDIGRRCIAAVLLRCESAEKLDVSYLKDYWAHYLHRIYSAESWEDLDYSKLKIITFNYDRALEHYLYRAIRYTYDKTPDEAISKLRELEIVHVYGSLGPILRDEPNYSKYGSAVTDDVVLKAANSLKVIREGNTRDSTFQRAQEILQGADGIAFLGFSFDAANMERLNAHQTCARWMKRDDGMHQRRIVASCYGMTQAESWRAYNYFHQASGLVLPEGFVDGTCVQTLRETLILG